MISMRFLEVENMRNVSENGNTFHRDAHGFPSSQSLEDLNDLNYSAENSCPIAVEGSESLEIDS